MGDLHAPVIGAVVLASATARMVLRVSHGNHPLFKVPQYQLVHPAEFAVYAASKAFVLSFSEALAKELEDTNITVTALMPGRTDTDFFFKAHIVYLMRNGALNTRRFQIIDTS